MGTSTVSDAGTADGNLDDECSVVEISELGSYTGDPVQGDFFLGLAMLPP